ncbi:MAG: type IV toxin-antitoxin system AbiEi family antitoxin domain-containing protein [Proteobacteria bacterium]|nr:type IV toxin-antitoxin system AbiEi family antitoxin domain-containing protein [Pseudomonadota bacterium]
MKEASVFRAKDALSEIGVSQATLSRWAKKGKITRLARGIYATSDIKLDSEKLDLIIACTRFGEHSSIGGLSALFYYGLIEQVPNQLWVITTPFNKNETYKQKYRTIRTQVDNSFGVEQKQFYRITSIERTLIECLKLSTKIGLSLVLKATRKALDQGLTNEIMLGKMAKKLNMTNILQKYWQSIV